MSRLLGIFFAFLVVSTTRAQGRELFHVDTNAVREIAEQAAHEEFPDISDGDLVEELHSAGFTRTCRPALDETLATSVENDIEHWRVQINYRIRSTIVTEKLIDERGNCVVS